MQMTTTNDTLQTFFYKLFKIYESNKDNDCASSQLNANGLLYHFAKKILSNARTITSPDTKNIVYIIEIPNNVEPSAFDALESFLMACEMMKILPNECFLTELLNTPYYYAFAKEKKKNMVGTKFSNNISKYDAQYIYVSLDAKLM